MINIDFSYIIQLFLNLDENILQVIYLYGNWIYTILFGIIFSETGFVLLPFLPGDSLIFAVGTIAAIKLLNIYILYPLLLLAAIMGDNVNYWIGRKLGIKVLGRFINKKYLKNARDFFIKHGNKSIILARFVPLARTFVPFTAGISKLNYLYFLKYDTLGGFIWVTLALFSGYLFGNIPVVQENFSLVIVGVIIISFLPILVEFIKNKIKSKGL